MDPGPLRHAAATRALNGQHIPHGALVLEGVVVDLAVVARDGQIIPRPRELENIAGDSAGQGGPKLLS